MQTMKDVVESDLPEALKVLKDIKKSSAECLQNLKALVSKVKEGPTTEGMSFLDVKNQLMSSYMANMGLLMDKKLCGQSVKGHSSIDRLVEIRTVLEKMRPIEHKLKYQINKVINAYKEGNVDPADPRKFRANFSAFSNVPDGDSSGDEDKMDKSKETSQLYVAPKLAPAHYSDDETAEERMKKTSEIKRRKSLSSTMLKELREQYTDAPVEITENFDLHRFKANKKEQERIEYEERNFMRMSLSKKEETGRRKIGTMSALGSLADFDGIGGYDGAATKDGSTPKKRKMSAKKGSKHGKKGPKTKKRKK